jgi:hypothetical protein
MISVMLSTMYVKNVGCVSLPGDVSLALAGTDSAASVSSTSVARPGVR